MKYLILCFPFMFFAVMTNAQTETYLYPIEEQGLYGFIDKEGELVVAPNFHALGFFSEGLAAARKKGEGLYGYIDQTGNYVIPPKFDYAGHFEGNLAVVWIKDKPYFIDRNGEILFEHDFAELHYFGENELAEVESQSGNFGMINRKGNLVVDTIYSQIRDFVEDRAVVYGLYNKKINDREVGLINEKGSLIVPMGKFEEIETFQEGLAKVTSYELNDKGELSEILYIDLEGKIVINLPPKYRNFPLNSDGFENGRLTVAIKGEGTNGFQSTVINKKGEIIFHNPNFNSVTPYREGRAFARILGIKKWRLIDEGGHIIGEHIFETVGQRGFKDGLAFVKTKKGWGIIDRKGDFVMSPKFDAVRDVSLRDSLFIFYKKTKRNGYSKQYLGIANIKGEIVIPAQFPYLFWMYGTDKMFYVQEQETKGYMDLKGNYVWKGSKYPWQNKELLVVNDDRMEVGRFYNIVNGRGDNPIYSWGTYKVIEKIEPKMNFVDNQLSVEVRKSSPKEAFYLFIANTTHQDTSIQARYNRFNIVIQAKDKDGIWKDIEYIPEIPCGNGFRGITLHSGECWKFEMPHYQGVFDTHLRVKLTYSTWNDFAPTINTHILYSNIFKGGVNPGQFWRKKAYYHSKSYLDHRR